MTGQGRNIPSAECGGGRKASTKNKKKMENMKKKKIENLNEEREIRTDKEMIKRKCKIEKNGGKFEQRERRKNR